MHIFHTNVFIGKSIKRKTADDDLVASESPQMARHSPQLCACIKHDGLSCFQFILRITKEAKNEKYFDFFSFCWNQPGHVPEKTDSRRRREF